MSIGFPNIRAIQPQAPEVAGEVRCFEGDGSVMLPVPGLQELLGVRLGQRQMPLAEKRTWPLDPSHEQKITVPIDLFILDHLPDGQPVLLRNECCNDGVFQSGFPFYVAGHWSEDVPAPPEPILEKIKPKKGMR